MSSLRLTFRGSRACLVVSKVARQPVGAVQCPQLRARPQLLHLQGLRAGDLQREPFVMLLVCGGSLALLIGQKERRFSCERVLLPSRRKGQTGENDQSTCSGP